jgi:hypothetical protein
LTEKTHPRGKKQKDGGWLLLEGARSNLGLGSAAKQNTSAFDVAGAATTALISAKAYSSNASDLTSDTAPVVQLPVATTSSLGVIKPDNSTTTFSAGWQGNPPVGALSTVPPSGAAAAFHATPASASGRTIVGSDLPLATASLSVR